MEAKYRLDTEENKSFLKEIREELLRFGKQFPAPGGESYYLGDDGTPWKDRNKETWITSRMAHVYSIGALLGQEGSLRLASEAIRGLRGTLQDQKNGGWYAGVRADGSILPTKQCYAHAFVILAATSAKLAGVEGAEELLQEALRIYDTYFWEESRQLALDGWDTDFTKLDTYRGLNANMHSVEAFLAVADVCHEEKYRIRAGQIINHVIQWGKENSYRIPEHFSENWIPDLECNKEKPDDPFKPYGATPGHGIEWARLIVQWATSTYGTIYQGTQEFSFYADAAQSFYRRAITDAWQADGEPGIVYTTDWNGKPVVHDRMHWTLAEAINTSAVLFRVTGKTEYAEDYAKFMKYLDQSVLDHQNGSWFHQLDANNRLLETVWPGKSDLYHAFQATLIPYHAVDCSIAKAVELL